MPEPASELPLVPVEERTVVFYDDEIPAAIVAERDQGREIYIPLRPLCEFLGVNYRSQRRRIANDPVLSEVVDEVKLTTAGGPQAMPCIPLDYLNGWLFGIQASTVKEAIRGTVVRYQRECYKVLAAAFQQPLTRVDDPLVQVEELGRALINLAREQRQFDHRLGTTEHNLDDVTRRVVALEERADEPQTVTDAQASQISQAVKSVALQLGRRSGRNEYGGVYGELYRRFGITSYKLLPAARFQEAMQWLTEWYQQLADSDDVPF